MRFPSGTHSSDAQKRSTGNVNIGKSSCPADKKPDRKIGISSVDAITTRKNLVRFPRKTLRVLGNRLGGGGVIVCHTIIIRSTGTQCNEGFSMSPNQQHVNFPKNLGFTSRSEEADETGDDGRF